MNQNQIKWLATIFMVIDHIGFMIESQPMRIIGRLSFPLFMWIFAQNWQRPGSKKNLINRLILFGAISQIPYILLFNTLRLNIMFSFGIIAITFAFIRKFNRKLIILIGGMIVSQILNVDYTWYGIICSLMMINYKREDNQRWWISWIVINIIYAIFSNSFIQLFAIFTPIILIYYDPSKDKKPTVIEKKFFYYFYPIHLAILTTLHN